MTLSPDIKILKEVKLPEATIRLREDGIVHVIYEKNVTLDVELQMKMFHLYKEVTDGKKLPFVFTAMEGVSITKEARDNAIKIEEASAVCAVAVVADSLAYKLIANFYLKVNRPKSPYAAFTKLEDAIQWLQKYRVI